MPVNTQSADYVALFAALADRTRLRLLNLLGSREVCVCYLVEALGQSQAKISRHLAYLRRSGVVAARREGKWMHYRVLAVDDKAARAILAAARQSFALDPEMLADLSRMTTACCAPEESGSLRTAPRPASSPSPVRRVSR